MGMGVWRKRFLEKIFSLEWKSEGVMDDDSGDNEEDEGEDDNCINYDRTQTFSDVNVCSCIWLVIDSYPTHSLTVLRSTHSRLT